MDEEERRKLRKKDDKGSPLRVNNQQKFSSNAEKEYFEQAIRQQSKKDKIESTIKAQGMGHLISNPNSKRTGPIKPQMSSYEHFSPSALGLIEENDSKAIDEIAKLKNEIEDLTNSLRVS